MRSIIDFMSEEDYARYNELLAKAREAKSLSGRVPKGPMTKEQKIKMAEGRLAKLQAKLDALLAADNG